MTEADERTVADRWLVISVSAPSGQEAIAELAEGLVAVGGSAVSEEGDRLVTYLSPPEDVEAFVEGVAARLGAMGLGEDLGLEWEWRPDADWSERWRQGLRPRRVGERVIVSPSWCAPEPQGDEILIVVDPEMAFGTGEHGTTRGVLRLLESAIRAGDRVLDVGTGSGILAIAAVRLGASEVLAVDSDADAIRNARSNMSRNGVGAAVDLVRDVVTEGFLARLGPGRFDLIVANVLSSVLVPLLTSFRSALASPHDQASGGRLILGGILTSEANDIVDAANATGFTLRREDVEEEWWSGLLEASADAAP